MVVMMMLFLSHAGIWGIVCKWCTQVFWLVSKMIMVWAGWGYYLWTHVVVNDSGAQWIWWRWHPQLRLVGVGLPVPNSGGIYYRESTWSHQLSHSNQNHLAASIKIPQYQSSLSTLNHHQASSTIAIGQHEEESDACIWFAPVFGRWQKLDNQAGVVEFHWWHRSPTHYRPWQKPATKAH